MRRLHDEYRYTTVYVTHDQSEAMTTADLIAVMNHGRIEQLGTPEEIYEHPRSEFVARFIGSSNVVNGHGARRAVASRSPASSLRGNGGKLRAGGDGAMSIRQHDIVLDDGRAAGRRGERAACDRHPQRLPRRQPRLYGRGRGRNAVARPGAGRRRTFRRAAGCWSACPSTAAGFWSGRQDLRKMKSDCSNDHARRSDMGRSDEQARIDNAMEGWQCAEAGFRDVTFSRALTAIAASTVFASPLRAAAPPATAITPALIEAAKKEGKVVWYTSVDLPLAERIAKSFEAKFPGVACRVERTGAERVFQRIGQEYGSNIHAVDVVNSSDAAHLIVWKSEWLARAVRAGGRGEALSPPSTRTRMGRSPASACFSARSATTPTS